MHLQVHKQGWWQAALTVVNQRVTAKMYENVQYIRRAEANWRILPSPTFSDHISIEYCNMVKCIQCICKYINKVALTVVNKRDTAKMYENVQYIRRAEANWRILPSPTFIHKQGWWQAALTVVNKRDTAKMYENVQYIRRAEANWRILALPIKKRGSTELHLTIHFENGQRTYFTSKNLSGKLSNPRRTTLLAFFDL
ncbi:hypothetical protein PR048_025492 [Dryococelus australis]|uniref:Uncharacterized protein n=1 Tax=Dryococelus australis TaxID=614101 RepID=A0ABQ9GRJ4_9NEOP|nr:hypothetical protein PR048_025492 [Dryococelus australis]